MKKYFEEIIEALKKRKLNKKQLAQLKVELCRKHKLQKIPTDIGILLRAKAEDVPKIKKYLLTKPTRTISGVAVCAIMTKPFACPHSKKGGPCIMCPGGINSAFGNVPQSYTGKEPATRRAIRNRFDPYLQVMNRLEQYVVAGHVPDKIELIIMGGTFPSFPRKYQEDFVKYALKAMNDFSSLFFKKNEIDILKFKEFFELPGEISDKKRQKSIHKKLLMLKNGKKISPIEENKKVRLEEEQLRNEKSNIRCVGLTIETRPDYATLRHANEMLRLGATRVELGIQTIYDNVLEEIRRGHSVKDSIESTRILKDLGFKINYHVMPGLPTVTLKEDLAALREYFSNPDFRPDMLKIYPTMVLRGTKLYNMWKKGKYKPLATKEAAKLVAEFKSEVPEYVRIMRVQRDIPTFVTEAGVDKTNLRQYISKVMEEKGIKCRCIRCREIGNRKVKKIAIRKMKYAASRGTEYFISAESGNNIVGFCRLRFPSAQLRKEITKDAALIRELHVFGPAASVGKKGPVQHKGIGRRLLKEAEKISRKNKKGKIIIISGIGARDYYRREGYKKEGAYMVKYLNKK
jgi:elongator complex protein 3